MLDAAVSHLDDLQSLEEFLLNLGKKHQAVGVSTQSFAVRTSVIQTTLAHTDEVRKGAFLTVRLTSSGGGGGPSLYAAVQSGAGLHGAAASSLA